MPVSRGQAVSDVENLVVRPWNDLDLVRTALARYRRQIAAVICEPIMCNTGAILPLAGYLEGLRGLCTDTGTLLIFDEVITGFRVAAGGAQGRFGVRPDLSCLGKIIGGGLPVGAFGGRAEIMDMLAPIGPVYQAGTLSGNPVTMAAGRATLDLLDSQAFARLESLGTRAELGLTDALRSSGVRGCVQRVGSMLTLFLGIEGARNLAEVERSDRARFARLFFAMLERGFYLPPSPFEALFISLAHSESDVDDLVEAMREALRVSG